MCRQLAIKDHDTLAKLEIFSPKSSSEFPFRPQLHAHIMVPNFIWN